MIQLINQTKKHIYISPHVGNDLEAHTGLT